MFWVGRVAAFRYYLAPSLHFQLMVDLLKKDSVKKIQSKVTKFIKCWLNLPKCCTLASIFHPEVLKLPFLPHCQESAKSSLVSSIESSKDPLVKECVALLFDPEFISRNQFPTECPTFLQRARDSISRATDSSRPPSVKSIISKSLHQKHTDAWNTSLDQLQVQSKFKDVVALEPESRTYSLGFQLVSYHSCFEQVQTVSQPL